jgi:hypothetical protein
MAAPLGVGRKRQSRSSELAQKNEQAREIRMGNPSAPAGSLLSMLALTALSGHRRSASRWVRYAKPSGCQAFGFFAAHCVGSERVLRLTLLPVKT